MGRCSKGHYGRRSTIYGCQVMTHRVFKLFVFYLLAVGCRLKTVAPTTHAQLRGEWQFSDGPGTELAQGADLMAIDTGSVDVLRLLAPGLPGDVTLKFKRRTVRIKGYHGTAQHKYALVTDSTAVQSNQAIQCYRLTVNQTPYSLTMDTRVRDTCIIGLDIPGIDATRYWELVRNNQRRPDVAIPTPRRAPSSQ